MQNNIKFDFNDITLVPAELSPIRSRSEVDVFYNYGLFGKHLPLIVAPMDTVISDDNIEDFHGLLTCSIRKNVPEFNYKYSFISLSLEQFLEVKEESLKSCFGILIDIANAHMQVLYDAVKEFKIKYPTFPLMIGNIANPKTFEKYCEIMNEHDFIRLGIGAGFACLSSANTSIHYPLASLVKECYDISCTHNNPPKIVADGGFRNYDDVIRALNLGSDYVMIGSIFAKSLEASGDVYLYGLNISKYKHKLFDLGFKLKRKYRGMSTKEVQKSLGKTILKTSEGISIWVPVEYKLHKWLDNFKDYLKSAMSYSGTKKLISKEPLDNVFIGKQNYIHITEQAIKRYKK